MTELENLIQTARSALGNAFVKIDRGSALLVSDAPARGLYTETAKAALSADYLQEESRGLVYLTPRLKNVPERLRRVYIDILKSENEKRERLIRQALAECLRLKNADEAAFMQEMLLKELI